MKIETSENLIDQALDADSAPIFYWDNDGYFTPYSTEEVLANRWNGFKNWTCTAGGQTHQKPVHLVWGYHDS